MPVIFKNVRWKNFLSTGNAFTEVTLNDNKTSLIFGKNGSGKSTFLDAIVFGLFGKAFRNVNKPSLVNSINDKNCVVEIEFDVDKKSYKVVRGMKPNIFHIFCDGELVNQDSASKDYQKVLEQQILKFNYKTFTQVVILGSAQYVPFMLLPLAGRREVIEDLLDIRVFSIMNSLLKEKSVKTKDDITHIDSAVDLAKERVKAQQKLISVLEENDKERKQSIATEISNLEDDIYDKQQKIDQNNDLIEKNFETISKKMSDCVEAIDTLRSKMTANEKSIQDNKKQKKFFNDNDHCSVCKQDISVHHKEEILTAIESNIESGSNDNTIFLDALKEHENVRKELNSEMDKLNEAQSHNKIYRNEIKTINSKIVDLKSKLAENGDEKLTDEKLKLKEIAQKALGAQERKELLTKLKHIQEICTVLLKDGGIKTTIIKEYLPIFNKLINKYLAIMDLYVDFTLDETFNEHMKSRYRDTFTYSSFSEGEKQRIDLALLFAFRDVAKLKNSLSTNLIVLDEVFDSSLDVNGVEFVMQLLAELKDANVFVISHNTNLISSDIFDTTIQFEKKGDFSLRCTNKTRFDA